MKIVAFGGSIRSTGRGIASVMDLISECEDHKDIASKAPKYIEEGRLSNSEITAAAALLGAKQCGAEIEYFPLRKLFKRKEEKVENLDHDKLKLDEGIAYVDTLAMDEKGLEALYKAVETADGVILSTPVYFGDRSSVANKLLQLTNKFRLLENKPFGVV